MIKEYSVGWAKNNKTLKRKRIERKMIELLQWSILVWLMTIYGILFIVKRAL